jgi:hypothetical protein
MRFKSLRKHDTYSMTSETHPTDAALASWSGILSLTQSCFLQKLKTIRPG